eukprot:5913022-Ditylum_brightwellii.AAC.1
MLKLHQTPKQLGRRWRVQRPPSQRERPFKNLDLGGLVESDSLLLGTLAGLSQPPNSDLLSEDWKEIKALMCELDIELMHQHPSSTYIDVVDLAAAKSDPDTPSFKEALS